MCNLITPNQLFPLCVGKRSAVDTWAHLITLGPLCHLETALIRGWLLAQVPLLTPPPPLSLCWGGRKRPGSLADSHTLSHSSHPACLILVQPFTRHARTLCGPIQGKLREKSSLLKMSLFQGKLLLLLAAAAGRYTVTGRGIGNNHQEKGTWKSHFVRHEDNSCRLFFFSNWLSNNGTTISNVNQYKLMLLFYKIVDVSILYLGTSHFRTKYTEC